MIKEIIEKIEEGLTSPLSDKSNSSTFNAKKKKGDSNTVSVGDKDSETEMFAYENTIYQRISKKYYSQTFVDNSSADSYLRKIA